MNRTEILDTAKSIVVADREQQYGEVENNFATISKLWNAYLGDNVTDAHDVGMMMALLKIARIRTGCKTDDSYVDLAGYAACCGEIREQKPISEQGEKVIKCEEDNIKLCTIKTCDLIKELRKKEGVAVQDGGPALIMVIADY